jgi:endonuclease YncB( thermonuclease family)
MIELCYFYRAVITRVIDGDSCIGDIDLGFGVKTSNTKIRLEGIDTAEMRSKDPILREKAEKAKASLKEMIEGKEVYVKSLGIDKYGRSLATIYTQDGKCCNDIMKINNLAISYHGGTKTQELLKG